MLSYKKFTCKGTLRAEFIDWSSGDTVSHVGIFFDLAL
jgi:hypothetical protein